MNNNSNNNNQQQQQRCSVLFCFLVQFIFLASKWLNPWILIMVFPGNSQIFKRFGRCTSQSFLLVSRCWLISDLVFFSGCVSIKGLSSLDFFLIILVMTLLNFWFREPLWGLNLVMQPPLLTPLMHSPSAGLFLTLMDTLWLTFSGPLPKSLMLRS